jgi:ribulose-phosphate 3-epimerase
MKISASVQAANQLKLLEDIENNKNNFDQLHIDISDAHFAENISMSFKIIEQLKQVTNYYIDVHLMIENNVKYTEVAFTNGADFVTVHSESIDVDSFKLLSEKYHHMGIASLPSTPNDHLKQYLPYASAVLLLGVNPGFSNQTKIISLLEKSKKFYTQFPEYDGILILDGGIKDSDLADYADLGVDIVVQGGAIFG